MEKASKLKECKHCGAEMAASAKVCPKCGGKNPKVLYKRPWFIILAVIVVIGIVGKIGGSGSNSGLGSSSEKIEYVKCDISKMMRELDENASKASDKYMDQYIEVTGRLAQIDSDGASIEIVDPTDSMAVALGEFAGGITCNTGYDDEIQEKIKELKKEQNVTVKGQVTDVGEYAKYELKIDSIKD